MAESGHAFACKAIKPERVRRFKSGPMLQMTDRVHAITVVLKEDIRSDDVEAITNSIQMIKGVLTTETHVTDVSDHTARERARHELGQKLLKVILPTIQR